MPCLSLAVERLHSIDEARAGIFGSGGTPGSPSGAVGGDSQDDELASYPDDDNGDDWDFSDVPVDSYVDVHASLR